MDSVVLTPLSRGFSSAFQGWQGSFPESVLNSSHGYTLRFVVACGCIPYYGAHRAVFTGRRFQLAADSDSKTAKHHNLLRQDAQTSAADFQG